MVWVTWVVAGSSGRRVRYPVLQRLVARGASGAGLDGGADEVGLDVVEWTADGDNESAQRFYDALGFARHQSKVLYRVELAAQGPASGVSGPRRRGFRRQRVRTWG